MNSVSHVVVRQFRRATVIAVLLALVCAWLAAAYSVAAPARLHTFPGFSSGACLDPNGCARLTQGNMIDPEGLAVGSGIDPNGASGLLAAGPRIDPEG